MTFFRSRLADETIARFSAQILEWGDAICSLCQSPSPPTFDSCEHTDYNAHRPSNKLTPCDVTGGGEVSFFSVTRQSIVLMVRQNWTVRRAFRQYWRFVSPRPCISVCQRRFNPPDYKLILRDLAIPPSSSPRRFADANNRRDEVTWLSVKSDAARVMRAHYDRTCVNSAWVVTSVPGRTLCHLRRLRTVLSGIPFSGG